MASAFEAGRVFGAWVLAAHRASLERDLSARVAAEGPFMLTPAELRGLGAVPPGLPERAGRDAAFAVGILDDGRSGSGRSSGPGSSPGPGRSPGPGSSPVAMAFVVDLAKARVFDHLEGIITHYM